MKLTSDSFKDGEAMPARIALGKHHPTDHVELTENENPQLAWADLPEGTKSVAVVCVDPDAPSKPDDVNQEGKTVPFDLPRASFFHWALVDAKPGMTIEQGAFSSGVTPGGKDGPEGPQGTRQGLNNYTQWFEGDEKMAGKWFGYDGPCPPWNDERVHRYVFTAYALDVEKLDVSGELTGESVLKAIEGHILDQASITGTYHIYPDAKMPR